MTEFNKVILEMFLSITLENKHNNLQWINWAMDLAQEDDFINNHELIRIKTHLMYLFPKWQKIFSIENHHKGLKEIIMLEDADLTTRAYKAIKPYVKTLNELETFTISQIIEIDNLGKKSCCVIEDAMREYGLKFKDE